MLTPGDAHGAIGGGFNPGVMGIGIGRGAERNGVGSSCRHGPLTDSSKRGLRASSSVIDGWLAATPHLFVGVQTLTHWGPLATRARPFPCGTLAAPSTAFAGSDNIGPVRAPLWIARGP